MSAGHGPLRVALVGGPMYDHLYSLFDEAAADGLGVEVVVKADHPTLNREVAARLTAGQRLDVIATHSKYAPSQAKWLRPLDGLVDVGELAPLAVDLCRYRSALLCAPRLIDVRIMWSSLPEPPRTWAALADSGVAFGFPGRESGLFGTFFELVVGAGGRLFDDDGRPCIESPEAIAAVELLCRLAANAPDDLPDWHYDQVDAALLGGRVAAAGAWPGGWGPIRESGAPLQPFRYPAGDARWVSYAGCHAWGIPTTCGDVPAAAALVQRLIGREANALDARGGSVCAHVDAFSAVQPASETDRQRLVITANTIEQAMITYPPDPRFPEVEDAGWQAINDALRGRRSASDAVAEIQRRAAAILT